MGQLDLYGASLGLVLEATAPLGWQGAEAGVQRRKAGNVGDMQGLLSCCALSRSPVTPCSSLVLLAGLRALHTDWHSSPAVGG